MPQYPAAIQAQGRKARMARDAEASYTPSGIGSLGGRADLANANLAEHAALAKMLPGGTEKLVNSVIDNVNPNEQQARNRAFSFAPRESRMSF